MTQTPPGLEGQIHSPNPVELFWEKNRKAVLTAICLTIVVFAGYYGWQYMQRQAVNERWSGFAAATGLDRGYTEDGSLLGLVTNQTNEQTKGQFFGFYLRSAQGELVSELFEDLAKVDRAEIDKRIADARGKDTEPLLIWVAANRALGAGDWDACLQLLDDLEGRFAKHFLCVTTEYPVQFRPEKEAEKKEDEEDPEASKKPDKPPELEPAQAGSAVAMLRARVAREREFRDQHASLYVAPTPDDSPTVTITLKGDYAGVIKIRFFRDAAPKHVDNFLSLCKDGFFNEQRVHEIRRAAADTETGAQQLVFGLPSSKDADRTKWTPADDRKKLEFEENSLSHFPGMVAAIPEDEGMSSAERVAIVANDSARYFDGDRVIFGQVVEGLDLVRDICEAPFETEQMRRSGQGKPQASIQIESTKVE